MMPPEPSRLTALVLAAGLGTRMKSATPKVMHSICGKPLVHFGVRAALEAGCERVVVVVGHGREAVTAYLQSAFDERVTTAIQAEQRGTGDAARAGMDAVASTSTTVLVFYGDVPLLTADDLRAVVLARGGGALAIATCTLASPRGYGRILRDGEGSVVGIREERDLASDAERSISEVNPGVYAADKAFLDRALRALAPNNAQKELYLTDIVAHAAREAGRVATVVRPPELLLGVNDRVQLHQAEEALHARIHDAHRLRGVHVHEGARIDDGIEIGSDSIVESGAHLRAGTRIGARCRIGVGAVLEGAHVADDVAVKPYTVVTDSRIASGAVVGPFSHIRPGSELGERVHIGNFVETKKTTLGRGAKANHLAYLGDGVVGEDVNVGAGTIFCNYDGVRKHVTVIERGAFIGSDSQLVAPVRIGAGAYVGTGTTVTMDVPPGALAVGRARQVNKEGYAERLRARFKGEADAASADTKQGKGSGPG